jgi:hypothetical protein
MKEDVEGIIAGNIRKEYDTSRSNQSGDNAEFEAVIDMVECKRTEKNYEWLSDVFIPEYPATLLTESSQWANQYFASRDFVDVYLEGDKPDDQKKCSFIKKLLNRTLNRRGLYHYQKYMRARTLNSTGGFVYAICGWEQELRSTVTGVRKVQDGEVVLPDIGSVPSFKMEEVVEDKPVFDYFNYDVLDPRQVFTDNTYVYSIQDKAWVIVLDETTYEELVTYEKSHGYFNLKKVKELSEGSQQETETSKETYNKDAGQQKPVYASMPLDMLVRYGKMWAVIKEEDEYGNPTKIEYGIDDLGKIKENASLVEGISTVIISGSTSILVRFQATPFIDGAGRPYKPLLRGLCYIHPTKDTGMSDGKYARESQIALNDTINISNDRVTLATIPTFIGDKYACEDNDQIYIEPQHVIPIDGGADNLKEMRISDNIAGAMAQAQMFISSIHKITSVYEPTMGDMAAPSTSATATASADTRSNMRANYKSLTFEYTFLTELYWQIIQMSFRFMHPDTALEILGEEGVSLFDPNGDYTYKPITSSIELEHAKGRKMQQIDQVLGRIVNFPNPKTPVLINLLMIKFFEALGSEYQDIKSALLDEGPEAQKAAMGMQGQDAAQIGAPTGMTSNQNGVEVQSQEMDVRGM